MRIGSALRIRRERSQILGRILKQRTPLTRGHAVPEVGLEPDSSPCKHWDVQEHTESGPIRPQFDAVRDPKCGHCPHSECAPLSTSNANRAPHEGARFSLRWQGWDYGRVRLA